MYVIQIKPGLFLKNIFMSSGGGVDYWESTKSEFFAHKIDFLQNAEFTKSMLEALIRSNEVNIEIKEVIC